MEELGSLVNEGCPSSEIDPTPNTTYSLPQIYSLGLKWISRRARRDAETEAIRMVLEDVNWNKMKAARKLKISYKSLMNKIAEYELPRKASQRPD